MRIKLCYINQHWYVYLESEGGDSWMKDPITTSVPDAYGTYHLRKYIHPQGIPLFSYGYLADELDKRPGHKGEWSSNYKTINGIFDVNLWGIAFNQMSVAVPFEWIEELLGDRVEWIDDNVYIKKICSIKGHENIPHKWVEL